MLPARRQSPLGLLHFGTSFEQKIAFCSGQDMCIADSLGRQRQCLLEAMGMRGPAHYERCGLPEGRGLTFLHATHWPNSSHSGN